MPSPTITARRRLRSLKLVVAGACTGALLFAGAPAALADTALGIPGVKNATCSLVGEKTGKVYVEFPLPEQKSEWSDYRLDDTTVVPDFDVPDAPTFAVISGVGPGKYKFKAKHKSGVTTTSEEFSVEVCGNTDPDPDPEPSPKAAKPTVQVIGSSTFKTSKVSRTCRIFNTNDKTDKPYNYTWWISQGSRTVAKGTKSVADGKSGDVRVNLGVGSYTCWAQGGDGKASKSFTVRYAPSTFSVVNKSKGLVKVCHYSSSFKTAWQKPKKGGGWKSSKHWSKTKAQGSCTTRNTPNVGYGKTKKV